MSFRVLVTDYAWPNLEIERAILAEVGAELVIAPNGTAEEILALAGDVDAILTCWKQVPPADGRRRPPLLLLLNDEEAHVAGRQRHRDGAVVGVEGVVGECVA